MHRDIKPENILISPQGHMTYADFGLAFTSYDKSVPFRSIRAFDLVGTPGYFAPEILARTAEQTGYTPAADIYSLGLVLLELFGRLSDPFYQATTDAEQAERMCTKPLYLDEVVENEEAIQLLFIVRAACQLPVIFLS